MSRLAAVRQSVIEPAERLAEAIKAKGKPLEKDKPPPDFAVLIDQLVAAIRRAKSTSGVTMMAADMNTATERLHECRLWIRETQWDRATARLAEAVHWFETGISEDKSATIR